MGVRAGLGRGRGGTAAAAAAAGRARNHQPPRRPGRRGAQRGAHRGRCQLQHAGGRRCRAPHSRAGSLSGHPLRPPAAPRRPERPWRDGSAAGLTAAVPLALTARLEARRGAPAPLCAIGGGARGAGADEPRVPRPARPPAASGSRRSRPHGFPPPTSLLLHCPMAAGRGLASRARGRRRVGGGFGGWWGGRDCKRGRGGRRAGAKVQPARPARRAAGAARGWAADRRAACRARPRAAARRLSPARPRSGPASAPPHWGPCRLVRAAAGRGAWHGDGGPPTPGPRQAWRGATGGWGRPGGRRRRRRPDPPRTPRGCCRAARGQGGPQRAARRPPRPRPRRPPARRTRARAAAARAGDRPARRTSALPRPHDAIPPSAAAQTARTTPTPSPPLRPA
jgi:hypothetical protein